MGVQLSESPCPVQMSYVTKVVVGADWIVRMLIEARLFSAKPAIGEQEIDSPFDRVRNGFVSHD
jgi:hypothetical protein